MYYSLPQWIALIGILFSGVVFFLYAKSTASKKLTIDGFLISDQQMKGRMFANTFAASTLSLAANIIYFVSAHRAYGWLMGVGPMLYLAIQFFILRYISDASLDLTKVRTAADLWYQVFPSKKIARTISMLAAITCLMTVFVELYVGSIILSVFFPQTPFYQALSFFLLGMVVLGYVYYGGYKAILRTDEWQLILIYLATIGMLYFAWAAPIVDESIKSSQIFTRLFSFSETGWPVVIFLLWACIMNLGLAIVDATIWQRMAAATSPREALDGLKKGFWKTAITTLTPMFGFIALFAKGNHYDTMQQFLDILLQQSGVAGYIVFPLIVTGFSAILFSTADTWMIGTIYSVCDQNTFLPHLNKIPYEKREGKIKQYLSIFFFGLIIFFTVFYYIQYLEIAKWIMPLLYAIWGQITILAPLPFYALYRLKNKLPPISVTKKNNTILMSFIGVSLIIILYGSLKESHTGLQLYSHVAFLVGISLVCIGLFLVINISKYTISTKPAVHKMKMV